MKTIIAISRKDLIDVLKNWDKRWSLFYILLVSGFVIYLIFKRTPVQKIGFPLYHSFEDELVNNLYKSLGLLVFDSQTAFILLQFNTIYFFLIGLIGLLPLVLSTTSIVAEKEHKTIENLFSLPLSDKEITAGKIIASILPSLLLSTLCYIAIVILTFMKLGFPAARYLLSTKWWLLHFFIVPIYALFSAWIGFCISLKAKSSRSAMIISFFPALLMFFLIYYPIIHGTVIFGFNFMLCSIFGGILLVIISQTIAKQLFNREKIICNY